MKQSNLPPTGTRDFLPEEIALRKSVIGKIEKICTLNSFLPIETPAVENLETMTGKYGNEGEKLIFKILKRGEKAKSGEADLALRYDLTVPALRFYAKNQAKLPRVFKRYQYGPVWRADRPGQGRYREFMQFDFDIYGSSSILADVECLGMVIDSLTAVGISNFTVNLNSREIIKAMMEVYRIEADCQPDVLRSIDKFDKIGIQGVIAEFEEIQMGSDVKKIFLEDFSSPDFAQILRDKVSGNEQGRKGFEDIDTILEITTKYSSDFKIIINPLMVRGLDYYTGPIYEITSEQAKGSIAAGGRYDAMSKLFLKNEVPVCGSSLGIERIILLLSDGPNPESAAAQVFVGSWDSEKESIKFVNETARFIRSHGISTEIDMTGLKLGKQFAYASKLGCKYFVMQGPDEKANNLYVLKNLSTGEQLLVKKDELIKSMV